MLDDDIELINAYREWAALSKDKDPATFLVERVQTNAFTIIDSATKYVEQLLKDDSNYIDRKEVELLYDILVGKKRQ